MGEMKNSRGVLPEVPGTVCLSLKVSCRPFDPPQIQLDPIPFPHTDQLANLRNNTKEIRGTPQFF